MAKRGYKLQEFVAHSANVNCISIGKKACRFLITGGDDQKVNLWAIGKPTALMSLCGLSSPVDSVAFDSAEVLVLAGASTGVIKLWDLEESKMVRTLTGHKSNCTAVEFHPFGEFFASGCMDTNLKIWDIRKKGCIHTYKGHTRGINTIRFTPDGRWVVSGGFDNVVKVWDLTAGKLLHDFKFHEGHIRSIDFHPLEFLLATGSADRTVKFWDLETFELIGSTRPEVTGVRAITFHPDGRTLFSGFDDNLKVYSWEPVICHDSVEMGWSTLGDLCINDGKLLGCSFYRNSVGIWVADVSHVEPYGVGAPEPDQSICTEVKFNPPGSHSLEKVGIIGRSTSGFRSTSPDYETKDIKTIYVDSTGGKPVASQKIGPLNSPKVLPPLDSEEISDLQTEKQNPAIGVPEITNGQALDKSFIVPSIVPQESPAGKDSSFSAGESITFSRTKPGMLLRPAHVQKPSNSKYDAERLSTAAESESLNSKKSDLDSAVDPNVKTRFVSSDGARKSCEEKDCHIKTITGEIENIFSPQKPPKQEDGDKSRDCSKITNSVKFVNGVAVVPGRTRSLVERFERREKVNSNEDLAANVIPQTRLSRNEDQAADVTPQTTLSSNEDHVANVTSQTRLNGNEYQAATAPQQTRLSSNIDPVANVTPQTVPSGNEDQAANVTPQTRPSSNEDQTANVIRQTRPSSNEDQAVIVNPQTRLHSNEDQASNITPHTRHDRNEDRATNITPQTKISRNQDRATNITSHMGLNSNENRATNIPSRSRLNSREDQSTNTPSQTILNGAENKATKTPTQMRLKSSEDQVTITPPRARLNSSIEGQATNIPIRRRFNRNVDQTTNVTRHRRSISNTDQATSTTAHVAVKNNDDIATVITPHVTALSYERPSTPKGEPQISGRDTPVANEGEAVESLMETHDIFISTLRSRLTKLQVVRHFWERNDIKGGINALRKLPDHSVQADVMSVLMEKMEILNLDLFLCLLPMLMGLLDSKMERHASISLEMLLKLVVVFGPMIHSTLSAPPAVGVDLHAEQRYRENVATGALCSCKRSRKFFPSLKGYSSLSFIVSRCCCAVSQFQLALCKSVFLILLQEGWLAGQMCP
ncbi:Katanin p80 WD40 repeat-containing subunit B1 [Citrus sinensis]|nr:Katanin p80 WD40 repeat-containing subunit B1 [Citrus sinensis]